MNTIQLPSNTSALIEAVNTAFDPAARAAQPFQQPAKLQRQHYGQQQVVGRVTSFKPGPRRPAARPAPARPAARPASATPLLTDQGAKQLVITALQKTLEFLSGQPEDIRNAALERLVVGTSPTGFATINEVKISSIEGLRDLINSVHRLNTVKTFDRGNRYLFFFAVPRDVEAYAGEVKMSSLATFYAGKDQKERMLFSLAERAKAAYQADLAAGKNPTPPPEGPKPYVETTVPGTGSKWGRWMTLMLSGCRTDAVLMNVVGPKGVQQEYKPVTINTNCPMHKARTITFVVDIPSGQLIAWQPGRYVAEMTAAQKTDRVILTSGDTTEEES